MAGLRKGFCHIQSSSGDDHIKICQYNLLGRLSIDRNSPSSTPKLTKMLRLVNLRRKFEREWHMTIEILRSMSKDSQIFFFCSAVPVLVYLRDSLNTGLVLISTDSFSWVTTTHQNQCSRIHRSNRKISFLNLNSSTCDLFERIPYLFLLKY